MTNVEKYNAIADSLENRLKTGELTIEQANLINDAAYAKYVEEANEETELPKEDEQKKAKKEDKKPEEDTCDCGKKDCPICNPETDSEEDEDKPKKKSIKAKKEDKKPEEDENHEDDASVEGDDEEAKTESVDINAVKVHVYEAFDAGAISKAEKDLFLAVLE